MLADESTTSSGLTPIGCSCLAVVDAGRGGPRAADRPDDAGLQHAPVRRRQAQAAGPGRSRALAATGPASRPSCRARRAGRRGRRPARPARRTGTKSDDLDAARAAREALVREHLAQPRQRGDREAIRVLLTTRHTATQARTNAITHLKALVVNAPERLRDQLRARRPTSCWPLRPPAHPTHPAGRNRATVAAPRRAAQRPLALEAEATTRRRPRDADLPACAGAAG